MESPIGMKARVQMSATPSPTQLFLADSLPVELSNDEALHIGSDNAGQFTNAWPAGKRTWLIFAGFSIAIGIGMAVTLAWRASSDAAKEAIASAAALKSISVDLDAVRRSVDRIANNMAFGQEQMTRSVDQLAADLVAIKEQTTHEINGLQMLEQNVLDKISTPMPRPSATQTSKPSVRSSLAPIPLTPAKSP